MPADYSKTVIYKIVCKDTNVKDSYVGYTTDFKDRKRCHKRGCCDEKRKDYSYKVYKCIRENGGWDNWSMIEIEKYPCDDWKAATAREFYWFSELKCTLNVQVPTRTQKEYQNDNIDKFKENKHDYYINNIDKFKEYRSKTFECPCGCICSYHHKARHEKSKIHQDYIAQLPIV